MNTSRYSYEYITLHVWIRHATRMNTSRCAYEWVMSSCWEEQHKDGIMSEVSRDFQLAQDHKSGNTYKLQSREIRAGSWQELTYERVMAHMWMTHGTRVNESWHTCKYVISHRTEEGDTSRILTKVSHDSKLTNIYEEGKTYRQVTDKGDKSGILTKVWRMKESWHTCEWVMAHIWASRGTTYKGGR